MYPKPIEKLISLFIKLPGVGPRQAARMAFFILRDAEGYSRALSDAIRSAKQDINVCSECFKTMEKILGENRCEICRNDSRTNTPICIVEKEMDLLNFEKTGIFHGKYHVLGGTVAALDPDSPAKLKLKELYQRAELILKSQSELEIIIAMSPTSEGDTTANYLERMLAPLKNSFPKLIISRIGTGLSAGAEVEYADQVTLENAYHHRTAKE